MDAGGRATQEQLPRVWTLPPDTDDFPVRWRLIKLLFAKGLPRTERLSATRRKRSERGIWQRRYWEHTITTELDYASHIDYIHANPLKHGYVSQVQDLPKGHKGLIRPSIAICMMVFWRRMGAVIWVVCQRQRNNRQWG
jgi:hypothetical protein